MHHGLRPAARAGGAPGLRAQARPGAGRAPGAGDRPDRGVPPGPLRAVRRHRPRRPVHPRGATAAPAPGSSGSRIAIEEVAKYSNAAALMLLLTRLPTGPAADRRAARSMKRKYLTPIATGEQRAAFGLSEPQAGSDVMGMRTKAVQDGDDWVLTGTKCWMSGVRAGRLVLRVRQDRPGRLPRARQRHRASSSSAAGTASRSVASTRRWACKGVDTGELLLDDVRVPAENIVGDIGGFRLCMLGLNSMRPIVAARGIGLAEGALMYAVEYAKQREAFTQDDRRLPGHPVEDRRARDRDRGRAPAHLPRRVDGRPGPVHQGVRALPLDVQVLRDRARGEGRATTRCRCSAPRGTCRTTRWSSTTATPSSSRSSRARSQVQLGLIAKGVLDHDLWWD